MKQTFSLRIFMIGIMLVPFALYAQDKYPVKSYIVTRVVGTAPVIDGRLDDTAWKRAKWASHFVQHHPLGGEKPSQETSFKILYDDNNLYIALRCYDSQPGKINKSLSRRDNINSDYVGIFLDSYSDKRTAFGFFVSAAGVKLDGKFTNDDGNIDKTWNSVWYVKTSINSKGWIAEMRIPLSQLRFAEKPNMSWGLEVSRYIFRKQEQDLWQPIPNDASGFVSNFGLLKGIKNIKPKREISVTPYVMSKLVTAPKIIGDPFATGNNWSFSAGLDGTIGVTNDLTLNFTINPDFGEVNADPSLVNLTAFESYFPELRPFFVEGSNIFNFPLIAGYDNSADNLFYSRRIGRPPQYSPQLADSEYIKTPAETKILAAFKLSGKTHSGWSIGTTEALAGKETASIDSLGKLSKVAVEPATNYFNARLQKDFKNGNTILGGMFTATNRFIHDSSLFFLPDAAYTGGIDFRNYWKDHAFRLSAKFLTSTIVGRTQAIINLQENPRRYFQRPGNFKKVDSTARILQGTSASVDFSKIGRGHWRYGLQTFMESPGLELNDQGYLRATDLIQEYSWLEYDVWKPFSIFRNISMQLSQYTGWNFSGKYIKSNQELYSLTQFKNYWYSELSISHRGTTLDWNELRGGPALLRPGQWNYHVGLATDSRKKFIFSLNFSDNAYLLNAGNSTFLSCELYYQPLSFLNLSITPAISQSHDNLIYVTNQEISNQNIFIVSSIKQKQVSADLRVSLSFTKDLSLEYWGQPFLFSAKYYGYKKVQSPDQNNFESQFYKYYGSQIHYDGVNNQYLINDPAFPGSTIKMDNPDFSVVEFRSNMVLRWEFAPGSSLYLVWSQSNSVSNSIGDFNFKTNWTTLINSRPTNIFLVKFSYRIEM